MAVERPARAKINLALHVTGRRPDGYHMLDLLVAFAEVGDTIAAETAERLSLTIDGPMAAESAGLSADLSAGADNLVLRAARLIGPDRTAAIRLTKRLPVASGIGGGSADAAATLLALADLWSLPLPAPGDILSLGADVPVCLSGRPARMRGIGEIVKPLAAPLPPVWLVLANPGVAIPTPAVFAALTRRDNPALPEVLPAFPDAAALASFLATQRNDLAAPATALEPVIAATLAALSAQPGCLLARMSGSGATCFALFAAPAPAEAAAAAIRRSEPRWWTIATPLAR